MHHGLGTTGKYTGVTSLACLLHSFFIAAVMYSGVDSGFINMKVLSH